MNYITSEKGLALIKHFEGLNDGDLTEIGLQPKKDPSSIWTIGWGRAICDTNGKWLTGDSGYKRLLELYPNLETITIEEADQMLSEDLGRFEDQVNSLDLKINQYQFDAIVSFVYNCGFGNFLNSTLIRRIKSGIGDIEEAWSWWNKSGGVVLKGLILRRACESHLFLTGELKFTT